MSALPLVKTFIIHLSISMEAPLLSAHPLCPLCLCLGFDGGLRIDSYYKRTSLNSQLSLACCFLFWVFTPPRVPWSWSGFVSIFCAGVVPLRRSSGLPSVTLRAHLFISTMSTAFLQPPSPPSQPLFCVFSSFIISCLSLISQLLYISSILLQFSL